MIKDSNIRTIVKSISYRTAVAISIFLASYAMGYSAGFGLSFVVLSYTVGFASFYVQERIWNLFSWQKKGLYDTKIRSVAKTITWRLWALIVLFVVALILGLEKESAAEWSLVTNVLFFVVHFLHERLWNRINWKKYDFL